MINGRALKLGASLRDDRRTPIEQLKTQYFKQLSHQKIDGPNEYELRRTFEAKKKGMRARAEWASRGGGG